MISVVLVLTRLLDRSHRFVDPAFAFTLGWNYWYVSIMTIATLRHFFAKPLINLLRTEMFFETDIFSFVFFLELGHHLAC